MKSTFYFKHKFSEEMDVGWEGFVYSNEPFKKYQSLYVRYLNLVLPRSILYN